MNEILEKLSKDNPTKIKIGGSLVGALAGVSKWFNPTDIYNHLIDTKPQADNDYMLIGRCLEDAIIKILKEKGVEVKDRQKVYETPRYTSHFDGIIDEHTIIEIKTTRAYITEDNIPPDYLCQLTWYMGMANYFDYPVYQKGKLIFFDASLMLREFEVIYDEELFKMLVNRADDFFTNYLIPQIPPVSIDTLKTIKENEVLLSSTPAINKAVKNYQAMGDAIKAMELQKEGYKNEIVAFIQENQGVITDAYKVTYKLQTRNTLNTTELKEKEPDIYNKYLTESSSRVLRVSKLK